MALVWCCYIDVMALQCYSVNVMALQCCYIAGMALQCYSVSVMTLQWCYGVLFLVLWLYSGVTVLVLVCKLCVFRSECLLITGTWIGTVKRRIKKKSLADFYSLLWVFVSLG